MRLLITLPLAVALLATPAAAQDLQTQLSPVYGGSGGTAFTRDCGAGRVMAGVRGRTGLVIDAIGLICRQVLADGTLGPPSAVGLLAGGGGGGANEAQCRNERPVMVGIRVVHGLFVDALDIRCGAWAPATRSWRSPALDPGLGYVESGQRGDFTCGSSRQPMSGIRGRAGVFVDAIGAKCDEP